MQELTVTLGLPASGKTTWTLDHLKKKPETVNINRDDLRLMMHGRFCKFSKTREQAVSAAQKLIATDAISKGKSVVISDTNLNPKTFKIWEDFAKSHNIKFTVESFTNVPLGVCLDRDAKREFPVGGNVIMRMFNQYESIYWPKPTYVDELPDAYIVDVDGTLAHMHNRHPYQWESVKNDLPNQDIIDIVNALHTAGNKIIICSGRDGVCHDDTVDWLIKNNIMFNRFYIRKSGDNRKDYVVKREIYDMYIANKYNVKGVFDDRDQVINLWRQLGLTACQVNFGAF